MLKLPILFENSSEDINTLGLGPMTGFIDWTVTTERNMIPKLEMNYKVNNYLSKEIKTDRIIMADASNRRLNQLFRINKITGGIDTSGKKTIKIEASHVAGDIIFNSIKQDISLANASPIDLWNALIANLTDGVPDYTFSSNIKTLANVNLQWKQVTNLNDILFGAGTTGTNGIDSFIKLYDGEWEFDNYHLTFNASAGQDNGQVIKYGQNLTTLQQDEAIDNTYTAVQAYATKKEQGKPSDYNIDKVPYQGSGLVQYLGAGGLQEYDRPGGSLTGKAVQNGQHINLVSQYVDKDNQEWLQLDDGNWIYGKHVVVDSKGSWIANNVIGQGHIKWNISSDGQGGVYETVNGVLVANYLFGDVSIYSAPDETSNITGTLNKAITQWKVFLKTKDDYGVTWYNLGGSQWVSGRYVQFDKQSAYTYTPGRGVGTVNHDTKVEYGKNKGQYEGVALWSLPKMTPPSQVVKYVYHGQRYKIFQIADNNGTTFYNLGGNQWIPGQYMKFDANDNDVKPVANDNIGNANATAPRYSGYVVVYDHPGYERKPTGQKLYSGDEVNIISQAQVSGGTWYEVGQNQWIDGHYVDFGKDTDVNPYDPSKDIVINVESKDVTLTLPNVYMKAPNADKYEHLKIIKVDLSQYNVDSVEKLEEVTKAYIYDNHIGEPTTQLTVGYYQMQGELAGLTDADIYDRGTVFYPKLDINVNSEVTHGVWNGAKHRWQEITFGKRPETLRDTLEQYIYQANDNTRQQLNHAQQQIEKDADVKWKEMHDEIFTDLYGDPAHSIPGKITPEGINNALKQYENNAQSIIKEMHDEIASKASISGGVMHYEKDRIWADTVGGGQLSITSQGMIYTGPNATGSYAVDFQGNVIANSISAEAVRAMQIDAGQIHTGVLSGITISGVQITGGKIQGVEMVESSNPATGDYTQMSAKNGLGSTNGINVKGWVNFGKSNMVTLGNHVESFILENGDSMYGNVNGTINNVNLRYEPNGYGGGGFYLNAGGHDYHIVTN